MTDFDNLSYCIITILILHSLSEFVPCGNYASLCNNCKLMSFVASILRSLPCITYCAVAVYFSSLDCLWANIGILCLLGKKLCGPSSYYAVVAQEQTSWIFVYCAGALQSLVFCCFLLWLVRHVVALWKVIQGPCHLSRDYAYMGTVIGWPNSRFPGRNN